MPNNWKTYKLTELVENIVDNRGKTCPTDVSGIPLIATNCIRNEKLYPDFINVRFVSDETYNNWFRAHPKPDDMLFVLKGTPGRVCWTPNPINFCIAQDMVALRAKKDVIYPKYLFALLRSKIAQDKINALHVGSLIPHFKKTDFDKLELPVFEDINYQKEIGDIYFDICNKIENNLAINKTLEEMAMALYKHWFVDFGPFQDGEFVESELGRIPKGWEVMRLDDIITVKRGGSPRPIQDFLAPSGLPWVKISDATASNSPYLMETKEFIKEEGLRKTVLLKKGSLILSNSASPGIPKFLELDACIHDGWLHFPEINRFGKYLLFLTFLRIKEELIQKGNGSVFTNLKTDILKSQLVTLPPKEIEEKINFLIKSFFKKIRENSIENQTLTQLRDTLLPKLISGEVRLKEFQES